MGIEETLSFNDGMTPILENIIGAMTMVVGGFFDIKQATAGLETENDFSAITESIAQAGAQLDLYKETLDALASQPLPSPPEWQSYQTPEIMLGGTGRLEQEMSSAQEMMAQLAGLQADIAVKSQSMDILPTQAINDIRNTEMRIYSLMNTLNELEDQMADAGELDDTHVIKLNQEYEALRGSIADALDIQKSMNEAMEQGDISKLNLEYKRLNDIVDNTERDIRDNITAQEQFNRELQDGAQKAGGLADRIGGAVKAYLGIQSIKKAFDFTNASADAYAGQLMQEQRLATVMQNTMGVGFDDFDSIRQLAAEQQQSGVIGSGIQLAGAQELGTYLTQAGSLQKLIPVMNDMLAQQYELNATEENAVQIGTMLGKVMDGQVGALSRYGYAFDEVQEEILKYGSEAERVAVLVDVVTASVGGMNEALAQTSPGNLKQIQNDMGDILGMIGGGLQPALLGFYDTMHASLNGMVDSGALDFLVNMLILVVNMAGYAVSGIGWLVDSIYGIGQAVADNWAIIGPILAVISTVSLALIIAQLWAMIPPLLGQLPILQGIAMQWLATHWPILAVGAAIGLLLVALNHFGFGAEEVLGFVGGLFFGFEATVYNVIASIANGFITFVEFFVNVFNHPIFSVKKMFADLAGHVIDMIKSIAEAIDAVFGSNLSGALGSMKNQLTAWVGDMPDGYKVLNKLELKNIAETAQAGYDFGAGIGRGIEDGIEGLLSQMNGLNSGMDGFDPSAFGFALDGVGGLPSEIDMVGKVGKIGDTVDISSEELKYLKDIAEREAINVFTTNTVVPQLQVLIDKVEKAVDMDEVYGLLTEMVEEEMYAMSEEEHV